MSSSSSGSSREADGAVRNDFQGWTSKGETNRNDKGENKKSNYFQKECCYLFRFGTIFIPWVYSTWKSKIHIPMHAMHIYIIIHSMRYHGQTSDTLLSSADSAFSWLVCGYELQLEKLLEKLWEKLFLLFKNWRLSYCLIGAHWIWLWKMLVLITKVLITYLNDWGLMNLVFYL